MLQGRRWVLKTDRGRTLKALHNWVCTRDLGGTLLWSEASRNSHHQKQRLHEWQRKAEIAWAFQGSEEQLTVSWKFLRKHRVWCEPTHGSIRMGRAGLVRSLPPVVRKQKIDHSPHSWSLNHQAATLETVISLNVMHGAENKKQHNYIIKKPQNTLWKPTKFHFVQESWEEP